jgi:hypothetical protein
MRFESPRFVVGGEEKSSSAKLLHDFCTKQIGQRDGATTRPSITNASPRASSLPPLSSNYPRKIAAFSNDFVVEPLIHRITRLDCHLRHSLHSVSFSCHSSSYFAYPTFKSTNRTHPEARLLNLHLQNRSKLPLNHLHLMVMSCHPPKKEN